MQTFLDLPEKAENLGKDFPISRIYVNKVSFVELEKYRFDVKEALSWIKEVLSVKHGQSNIFEQRTIAEQEYEHNNTRHFEFIYVFIQFKTKFVRILDYHFRNLLQKNIRKPKTITDNSIMKTIKYFRLNKINQIVPRNPLNSQKHYPKVLQQLTPHCFSSLSLLNYVSLYHKSCLNRGKTSCTFGIFNDSKTNIRGRKLTGRVN